LIDYCFDADRIAIPPFEFTNSNHFPDAKRSLMVEEEALPELIPAQDIVCSLIYLCKLTNKTLFL
jgi:hypothetical protein